MPPKSNLPAPRPLTPEQLEIAKSFEFDSIVDLHGKHMGRTPRLTPEVHRIVIRAIRNGMSEAAAARLVNIDPSTISGWKRKGAEQNQPKGIYRKFLNALRASAEHFEFTHLTRIATASADDWRASKALLEMSALTGSRYAQKHVMGGDPENREPIRMQIEFVRPALLSQPEET